MKKLQIAMLAGAMALVIGLGVTGCGGGGDSGGSPAKGLNATGFWENPLNGRTAAGNMEQKGGNLTAYLLLPPSGMGHIIGTIDGYHVKYTMAWDDGGTESGEGDFVLVNNSVDKLVFRSSLPSVGSFEISWRGPDFDHHDPAGVTLTYDPSAPTW
ncbi:MAG: hypothetical protein EPN23_05615 [Verrucomicrobia bacterium]|nr:MAG: hypothetical protein EPN23_05615 [Verrucomicrobiota bacterium]